MLIQCITISYISVEIEKKVKENENFDEIKINLLLQKTKAIKHILEKTTEDINDIIQKINKIYIIIDHGYTNSLDFLKGLQHGESLIAKEKKEFERRSSNINKLVNDFYEYEQTLREYKQIIALSEKQTTSIENLSLNINALKKLNSQLIEQYKACFTLKEKLKKITKPKFESTPSNVNATQTLFLFKVTSNNVQEQKTEAMATSLLPEKDNEFITNLIEHFFSTLAVVHLVSKITLGQGRANLAHIYIEKLNTYKEEIRKANIKLLENESSLISIENNYIQARLFDGKRALQRLARLIDSLIPILRIYQTAAKEFYQVNFEKDTFNKYLYFFKKNLFLQQRVLSLCRKALSQKIMLIKRIFFH